MKADIKLEQQGQLEHVVLEGDWTHCVSRGLLIDHPERRTDDGGRLRRAIVHNPRDGLTIDAGVDYPKGVRIRGGTTMEVAYVESLVTPKFTLRVSELLPDVGTLPRAAGEPLTMTSFALDRRNINVDRRPPLLEGEQLDQFQRNLNTRVDLEAELRL